MNEPKTYITVHGGRGRRFEEMFGTATVPVRGWRPTTEVLPGFSEPQEVFELDLEWVSEQGHRDNLVEYLTHGFGCPREFVDAHLEQIGVPILATQCTVTSRNMDFL